MIQARYGIDAPGLVWGFLITGSAMSVAGVIANRLGGGKPWVTLAAALLISLSFYPLGLFCLMTYESLLMKVRGREATLDLGGAD